jgi:hypothetical protein
VRSGVALAVAALPLLLLASGAPGTVPAWEAEGPAPTARLFAPGVISTGDDDAHVTFSPDGRHAYFLKNTPDFRHWTIAVVDWNGRGWGEPRVAPFSGRWAEGDLSFAPDGKTAYFVSTRPVAAGAGAKPDTDIWRLRRAADGWGEPEHVGELASDGFEWYPNLTADGWLYFGSERAEGNRGAPGTSDLWRARLHDGRFSAPENLGPALNTAGQDIEPWVSADGRMLLFASNGRADTRGSYDIYVSHLCAGGWSGPRNLGAEVNSSGWDFGPRPSPDGRYLFFTSNRVASDRPPERALSFDALLRTIRAPGNGLRDVYAIETAALALASPCADRSPSSEAGLEAGFPRGFREWTHVKTALIGPRSEFFATAGGLHHVYANPKALAGLRSGTFPDGAVLVFELLGTVEDAGVVAEGARKRVDVMVKDSRSHEDSGGWRFARYLGDDESQDVLTPSARASCFACHQKAAQRDHVFSQLRKD